MGEVVYFPCILTGQLYGLFFIGAASESGALLQGCEKSISGEPPWENVVW